MTLLPFANARHRLWRLEDGEQVVMLRGARRNRTGWRSDQPHAGLWGRDTGYILVPTKRMVGQRVRACLAFDPGLRDRSSEAEVLILGSIEQIGRLIDAGPAFCRARLRKPFGPAPEIGGLTRFRSRTGVQERYGRSKGTISPEDDSRATPDQIGA